MKNIKKIMAALVVTTIVIGGLVGCGSSASIKKMIQRLQQLVLLHEIKKRGTIKIGVFSDKAPFGYVDSNGKNQGFDVYIAKRFAKDLLRR